jgi:hypothetical protein
VILRTIHKLSLIVLLVSNSAAALDGDAPILEEWVRTTKNKNRRNPKGLVIKGMPESGAELEAPDYGFLRYVSAFDVHLMQKLNPKMGSDELRSALGFQTMLVLDNEASQITVIEEGTENTVVDIPQIPSILPEEVWSALTSTLGYNAVILDRKKDYFLIYMLKQDPKKGQQGIVIQDSEAAWVVDKDFVKSSALIELVEIQEQYGLFHMTVRGQKFSVGAKVQVE